ncbi:MAG: DsbA family protein [Deltaproteobacteria bacterium]|nr:DsbA family protein [Deltaproteobacteria bacterium]
MESITVYYDYMSPFAYFAAEVLPAFAERLAVRVQWRPIELLKLSNYANGLPYSEVKRRYIAIDAMRLSQYLGVPIAVPKPHPVASDRAQRLAAVALDDPRFAALHLSLFRAAWRDQRDLSSADVLRQCIQAANGPAEEWLSQTAAAETSAKIERFTAEAEAAGVFGTPAMIFRDELFWGIDSLPVLEWRIAQSRANA